MRQDSMNMSISEIIIPMLVIIVAIFVLLVICRTIANNYISKNKQKLFNKTKPLSDRCAVDCKKILKEKQTYFSYVNQLGLNQKHKCSSSVVSNASNNAIKYLIKYTNIEYDENSLQKIDYCIEWMNLFEHTLTNMKALARSIKGELPLHLGIIVSTKKLPYIVCDVPYKMTKYTPPKFVFIYMSPAGRSRRTFGIKITGDTLKRVKSEICAKMDKFGHAKIQRSAMTKELREAIKKRDNYTCCICGNSVFNEPNLLLEVDHIIPIAKGGKTEASNLQTLCWKCNRAKRDKM